MNRPPTKWVVVTLVFCLPVGLLLTWLTPWSRRTKWLITGTVGVLLVIGAIGNAVSPASPSTSSSTASAATTPPHSQQAESTLTQAPTSPSAPTQSPTVATTAAPPPTQPAAQPAPAAPIAACKSQAPSNPFGYDFCPGNLIYSPPNNVCNYFNCIASFWKQTNGYFEECQDGTYSHSGGQSGACSFHHGELRPVYSH